MSSFNQRECVGCGQPCDGIYYYLCTCQQCGISLINGIFLNCTYGYGKPVTCCECEGPLNGGFCSFYNSRAGNSFAYDPNLNSFDAFENLSDYPPQPSTRRILIYPTFYDDDDEYSIQYKEYLENSSNAITPDLPTEEPDNSLNMGDEHLSTISKTESDEVIKSSVENIVPIPNDSFEDIDYVEATPPDSELVSLGEVKDDILHEKLLNINLLIAKIESLNDNPTLHCILNTTTHADVSLPLECFYFKSEPDPGDLTSIIDPGIRENVSSTTNVNLSVEDDQSPLFTYVVWIFLPFLTIAQILKTHARGFVLRSLDLQIFSFILGIQYPNLID
nr:hypothetical protein [Tanacetum cinerariifolium]